MTQTRPARQFDLTLEIAAPADAVWKAVSEGPEIARWFAPEARADARVGGEIVWSWNGLHDWPMTVESIEPGKHLRTRYDSGVDDGKGGKRPLFIDFHVEGEGGTSTLRLVHSGFGPEADFDAEFDGISRGWPVELRSLRLYLEKHAGEARHVTWVTRDLAGDPDEAWRALTGDAGLGCGSDVDGLAEGAPFDFTSADGDRFQGTALRCQGRELTGTVTNWGDAFLRVGVENCGGHWQAWLWLATWGAPDPRAAQLKEHWTARLAALFPAAEPAGA